MNLKCEILFIIVIGGCIIINESFVQFKWDDNFKCHYLLNKQLPVSCVIFVVVVKVVCIYIYTTSSSI